jgi:hypothetical protein
MMNKNPTTATDLITDAPLSVSRPSWWLQAVEQTQVEIVSSTENSQMRAVRLDELRPRVIPRRIGIEPMTPLQGIPAQVTP